MNDRFTKLAVSAVLIVVLALALVPLAGAQEGPPQIGCILCGWLRSAGPLVAQRIHLDRDAERPTPSGWYPALNAMAPRKRSV